MTDSLSLINKYMLEWGFKNLHIGKKSVVLPKYYSLLLLIFVHQGTNMKWLITCKATDTDAALLRVRLQYTCAAWHEKSSTCSPRHFYGFGQICYSYHPEKNIRITGVCNKYSNCFCYLKNTLTHLIYCKRDQTRVVKVYLSYCSTISVALDIK